MPCLKIPATMDETQFKNEVRRLRPQLMVAARRHTGDSDCAEDIVQDALLRLWQLHANLHMPIAPLASSSSEIWPSIPSDATNAPRL